MEMAFIFALLKQALKFYNQTRSTLKRVKRPKRIAFAEQRLREKQRQSVTRHVLCILSLQFYISPGREGTIVFDTGPEAQIYKDKNGQLTVVSGWVRGGREGSTL